MRLHACITLLLVLSACATSAPVPRTPTVRNPRLVNLQRASALPWTDGGQCVVQEATQSWPVLIERCFRVIDHDRLEFHDLTGRCTVASMGAAAVGLGMCVLVAPEVIAGAVIVTGVVVVGFAIQEALEAYELSREQSGVRPEPETRPESETRPVPMEPSPKPRSKPEPKGPDFPPPGPTESLEQKRRRCEPIPTVHRGGDDAHNRCADNIPSNNFPGRDVFVNGKNFDALQFASRTLWEVKTDDFDKHSRRSQQFFIEMKLPEIQRERRLAEECGYKFVVGVLSEAHQVALERADRSLNVVVMDWC
jgi:hypothetical protein